MIKSLLAVFSIITIALFTACQPDSEHTQIVKTTSQPIVQVTANSTPTLQPELTPSSVPKSGLYPVGPSETWTLFFNKNSGIKFEYPDNWFLQVRTKTEDQTEAILMNAPTDSVIAVKGTTEGFTRISVDLFTTVLSSNYPFETYLNDFLAPFPSEIIVKNQALPQTSRGYAVQQITIRGLGETCYFLVHNENHVIVSSITYPQNEKEQQPYFNVFEKLANSIQLP